MRFPSVFQSQRQLNWGRKDTSQIPENLPGAFDGAYAAAQAEGFINDGTVFHHLDSPSGTGLFTNTAANTARRTLPAGQRSPVPVGALCNNIVGAVMKPDNSLRAGSHASPAGSAAILRHLCRAVRSSEYRAGFAHRPASPALYAAICTSPIRAASATGYQRGFIGKFLFHRHSQPFLSYGVWARGRLQRRSPS